MGSRTDLLKLLAALLLLALCGCPVVDDDIPPKPEPDTTGPLRVLVVEETADRGNLPGSQVSVFTSVLIRRYLNEHCLKDGNQPAYRFFDDDLEVPEPWASVMKQPRDSLPWIYIGNGTTGFSGPLPVDVEGTLELLKKYGGE